MNADRPPRVKRTGKRRVWVVVRSKLGVRRRPTHAMTYTEAKATAAWWEERGYETGIRSVETCQPLADEERDELWWEEKRGERPLASWERWVRC